MLRYAPKIIARGICPCYNSGDDMMCCSLLNCAELCCSVLQCVLIYCSQCCSVLRDVHMINAHGLPACCNSGDEVMSQL